MKIRDRVVEMRRVPAKELVPNPNQKSLKFRKSTELGDAVDRVAEDGEHPARDSVAIDEGGAVDAIMPGPGDGEVGLSLLDMDRLPPAPASPTGGEPPRGGRPRRRRPGRG